MKKGIIIDILAILLGLGFLMLASFYNFNSELLKTALSGIGATIIAVEVFDIAAKLKKKGKTKEIESKRKLR